MKPQKFSKKTYYLVVVLILLIGISVGGFLVLNSDFSTASIGEQFSQILEKNKSSVSGCQPNPSDKNSDADNDGLMDWQEAVYQTDSCRPDTDGDGYLDGEEVSSGYDPTKPAPDDGLPGTDTSSRALPQNLTRALAQNLSKQIIDGKLGNISDALDPAAVQTSNRIVNNAIQQAISNAMREFSLPDIPDSEIIITPDNSSKAIGNYARKISETIDYWAREKSIKQGIYESESEIFYLAVQDKDFTEINKYIDFYGKIFEEIKQIPAPSDFKDIHKRQLSLLQVTKNIFKAVKEIDSDPLKASLALEQYKRVMDLSLEMFQEVIERLSR
ncbi:thrombospondin type 3 repeat-containing protein [Patescibacteria group bacterium]|nr:thrombospondin type 3 repeat-containing protein [Patescibacteria group bacterium]